MVWTLAVVYCGRVRFEVTRHAKALGMHVIEHDLYVVGCAKALELITFYKKKFEIVKVDCGGVINKESLIRALGSEMVTHVALDILSKNFYLDPPSRMQLILRKEGLSGSKPLVPWRKAIEILAIDIWMLRELKGEIDVYER